MTKEVRPAATLHHEPKETSGLGFEPRVTQLRALVAVARETSYTRAARHLSYTESAVYLQIKSLERLAGLALVERSGTRISLTGAGEVVHRYALRVLEDVEAMARELSGVKGHLPIVVGGGRSTAVNHLTPLIAEFSRAHPDYQVELNIMPAEDLVSAVEEGGLDIAASGGVRHLLTSGQLRKTELRFTSWFRGGWVLVTPKSDPGGQPLKTLYLPEYAAFLRPDVLRSVERIWGSTPNIVMLAGGDAVTAAVVYGQGSAILPALSVRMEENLGLVTVRPITLNENDDVVMLIHRRPRLLTDGARHLLSHLVLARRSVATRRLPSV